MSRVRILEYFTVNRQGKGYNFRMQLRYLLVVCAVTAMAVIFQNCGKGFSPRGEDTSSQGSSDTGGTSGGSTGGTSGGTSGSTTGGTGTAGPCDPDPLPTTVYRTVNPSEAAQLPTIISGAPAGSKILLTDGTYNLTAGLFFNRNDVTLQGASRNADLVILDGLNGYAGTGTDSRVPELVRITASNVVITDLTLRNARDHIVHVTPSASAGNTGTKLHRLKIINPGEQAVKINANGAGSTVFTDNGRVTCSTIELQDSARPWVEGAFADGCYTGGIDMHQSRGWVIKNNRIRGFWCPSGLSEHGIHVWTGSRDTVVEQNWIEDSARGIGFGLGGPTTANTRRNYADNPCGGAVSMGHYGGRIVNNVVFVQDSRIYGTAAGFDVGIGLEDVCEVTVAHNTIYSTQNPYASMDVRFNRVGLTSGTLVNNLLSYRIVTRDGATATMNNNSTAAAAGDFVSAATGNLKLTSGSAARNAGVAAGVSMDFDGKARDTQPDLGAYEF